MVYLNRKYIKFLSKVNVIKIESYVLKKIVIGFVILSVYSGFKSYIKNKRFIAINIVKHPQPYI